MKKYFPIDIELQVSHSRSVPLARIAASYAKVIPDVVGSPIVRFSGDGLGLAPGKRKSGSTKNFLDALEKLTPDPHFARFSLDNEFAFAVHGGDESYDVTVKYPPSGEKSPKLPDWIALLVKLGRECLDTPGFQRVSLYRRPKSVASFPPAPPLAQTSHVVSASDEEIAKAYDDPEPFLSAWDKIETIKGVKFCTRALDALDEVSWMAHTFESQMAMARAAKPNLTFYDYGSFDDPRFAAWWEYGDLNDEKAGFPALSPYAYDEKTKTVDMAGFITKTPLEKGGPEPRHVLIREILDIRDILEAKRDGDGRAIESINVIWTEKWMALSEKRPLLDVGAKVFYKDGKKRVEVT